MTIQNQVKLTLVTLLLIVITSLLVKPVQKNNSKFPSKTFYESINITQSKLK